MAETDHPAADTPPKKPARRRSTTPAKSAAAKVRATKPKAEAAAEKPAKSKAKAPPKPRAGKRSAATATTPVGRVATRTKAAAKSATEKVGGKWGTAAIGAGLAAAGAAAALLTLRGSSAKPGDPATAKTKAIAHQPDGTDASASFEAKIADENTVPDQA